MAEPPKNVCDMTECPDCASTNIVCSEARQQLVCRDCGLIYTPFAPAPAVVALPPKLVQRAARAKPKRRAPKAKKAKKARKRAKAKPKRKAKAKAKRKPAKKRAKAKPKRKAKGKKRRR